MVGEAALGETGIAVEDSLDPSDISKIHSQTEDAHQNRLPGSLASPGPGSVPPSVPVPLPVARGLFDASTISP
jgi:hypothetical protein